MNENYTKSEVKNELKRVFCNCDGSYEYNLENLQNLPQETLNRLLFQMILFKSFPLLKLLIELGADVNHPSHGGVTPLHYACQEGQIEIAQHLVKSGALRLTLCDKGFSTLTYASRSLSLPMVKWACRQGCDPNHRDINGMTVLHAVVASPDGSEREDDVCTILDFLFNEGALVSNTALSPVQIAEANQMSRAAKILKDRTPKPTFFDSLHPFWLIIPNLITSLIEQGADINEKDPDGMTPLYIAITRGAISIADILIEKGADIKVIDQEGCTLLHILSLLNSGPEAAALTEKLIGMGLDVNAKCFSGNTPLRMAWEDDSDIAEVLKRHGGVI